MYLPKQFEETRIEVLHQMMRSHPFAALVTLGESGICANHIPFLLDSSSGSLGTLRGHVSRGNPVWKEPSGKLEALVIFEGPNSYISPSWYPGKGEHGKVVPTWNYAIVHAYGVPQFIEDSAYLLNIVSDLTDRHESFRKLPWKVADAPRDFIENQLKAIVGIEIPINRISGKWKASQNRSEADREGVIRGLESSKNEQAKATAELVRNNRTE
ncbi:MAG: FMN-binding negative transcriptional regulator [SAR324 cluster bacterium]|nr:FMN-binding negative transcriptional regulator [SAR324 cluster bacterium]